MSTPLYQPVFELWRGQALESVHTGAIAVVASFWHSFAQNREIQRTIRFAIEKGTQLDPALFGALVTKKPARAEGYLIGGICTLAVGIGLPILGYLLGRIAPPAFVPITGAGVMVGLIGAGLTGYAVVVRRWQKADKSRSN